MSDRMMKMMLGKKKAGSTLSDGEKKAKLQALMGMKDLANSHMGHKLKNLKKVTVASNSPEGLKAGLHKAEDMADQDPSDMAASDLEDTGTHDMAKFNKGSKGVGEDIYGGKHVAHMPEEFETDSDNAVRESEQMEGDGEVDPGQHEEEHDEEVPSPFPPRRAYADGTDDAENEENAMDKNDAEHQEDEESPESVDQIVDDANHLDSQELQELIEKLKMKLGNES